MSTSKSIKAPSHGKQPCLPTATALQPSPCTPSPCAGARICKAARENALRLKLALFFCQISFNPELSPDLIHTAAASVNEMENVVSGRNRTMWVLPLVAAPAFSGFNCR